MAGLRESVVARAYGDFEAIKDRIRRCPVVDLFFGESLEWSQVYGFASPTPDLVSHEHLGADSLPHACRGGYDAVAVLVIDLKDAALNLIETRESKGPVLESRGGNESLLI